MADQALESPSLGGLYPIRTLSSLTGVNPVTLRAWERRYGLLKPHRTPKGHRLYTDGDVARVRRILDLIGRGIPISQVKPLLDSPSKRPPHTAGQNLEDPWAVYRDRIVEAVRRFDERAVDGAYNEALALYPVDLVTRLLVLPLIRQLREARHEPEGGAAEEHFFSAYLRTKSGARFHHQSSQAAGPRLLAAGLPGDHHEEELLLFCLAALTHGYRIVMLGADMPLAPLPAVVERSQVKGVVLYGNAEPASALVQTQLPGVARALSVPVFLGGEVAYRYGDLLAGTGLLTLPGDFQGSLEVIDRALTTSRPPEAPE
jgi:DNA-binding transcriptional MerR regulator